MLPTAVTITDTPKAATVTVPTRRSTYLDVNPALTATVTGTVNGDTLNYTLSTTALQFSNAGTYPIAVTLGLNPNYTVTPTDGTLTVNKKAATVTAEDRKSVEWGENPALTATGTGKVKGDKLNDT